MLYAVILRSQQYAPPNSSCSWKLFVCLLVFTRTMRQPRFYFYHDLNIQDKWLYFSLSKGVLSCWVFFVPAQRLESELMKEFAVRNSIWSCQEKMHHVFCSYTDIPLVCLGDSLDTLTDFLLSYSIRDYFDIIFWPFLYVGAALIPKMKTKVSPKIRYLFNSV